MCPPQVVVGGCLSAQGDSDLSGGGGYGCLWYSPPPRLPCHINGETEAQRTSRVLGALWGSIPSTGSHLPPPPLPAWGGGFPTHPTDPTGREDAQHPPKTRTHSREGDSRAQPWGRVGGKGPPPQFPWGLPRVQPEPVVSPPSPPTISLPTGSPPHHGEGLGPVGRKPPPHLPTFIPPPFIPPSSSFPGGKRLFFFGGGENTRPRIPL